MAYKGKWSWVLLGTVVLMMIQTTPIHSEEQIMKLNSISAEKGAEESLTGTAVLNLQAEYHENKNLITLRYFMSNTSYVNIYVNGKLAEEKYQGTIYDYDEVEEGSTYEFKVEPYNGENMAGTAMTTAYAVPYKKAVVDEMDVEYNLEKGVLMLDWSGDNITAADVYQDNVLIGEKITSGKLVLEIKLEPLSKHIYRIVPYNKVSEVGKEKSLEASVEDYVAKIEDLNAEYAEDKNQIILNWEAVYTQAVTIYLNEELIVEGYRENTYAIDCKLQPGAAYTISMVPFNQKGEEGETANESVVSGEFVVPEGISATVSSTIVKEADGTTSAFAKPAVEVKWDAQARAVYEIYRAEKDKKSAYNWIANVTPDKTGEYTYIDEKIGIGNYYYKIRRKIVKDTYVEQELYTALSEADGAKVTLKKPKLHAVIGESGQILLAMDSGREFISGYDVYRKEGAKGYKKMASVTENECIDKAVEFGKTYRYKVKPYYYDVSSKTKTYGSFSDVLKIKNTVGGFEIEAASVAADTVKISWTAAANAQGYEIYYKTGTQGDSYVYWLTTDKLAINRKLKKTGTYCFMIKAYQMTEKGKTYFSSKEITFKMGFSAPTGFKSQKTTYIYENNVLMQQDKLIWNRVYGADGYYIDLYDEAKKKYKQIAKVKKSATTFYVVTNPVTSEKKVRRYRIRAYDGGLTKKGETIEIIPQLATVQKVKAVKSAPKTAQVQVSWRQAVGAELYRVYRSNGRTMYLLGETTETSMLDKGLTIGARYQYYVQAVNKTMNIVGNYSEPAAYIVKQRKVTGLKAVNQKAGTVALTWKVNDTADSYRICYKTKEDEEYKELAVTKSTGYVHKKQEVGTICYYRVVALRTNCGGVQVESTAADTKIQVQK